MVWNYNRMQKSHMPAKNVYFIEWMNEIFIFVSCKQLYVQPAWAYKTPNNQIIHYQDQGAAESNVQNNLSCLLFQALEIKFAYLHIWINIRWSNKYKK